jgi:4-carboxymuconolactone decarboxylase
VPQADRYPKRLTEQALHGDEIRDNLADLPEPLDESPAQFLTEFYFCDFTLGPDSP